MTYLSNTAFTWDWTNFCIHRCKT